MKDRIYVYLVNNAKGKENRIKANKLMKEFEIKDNKTFRKYIQEINRDKRCLSLIGAVSGKQGGYFIPISEEEKEEVINNRRYRANQMLRECHIMQWKRTMTAKPQTKDFYEMINEL